MWRWIRRWRDWAMTEIVTPRRLAGQPQAIYYRSEKGGLTLENQPVPWCAEAVVVEALLRLPPAARRRGDFSLRVPGFEPSRPRSSRPTRPASGTASTSASPSPRRPARPS